MARDEVSQNQEDGMTLGQRLAAAREKKGLVLEKAAHDTRIRAQRLRELEADDYSKCPHPSYARMFLMDYAKYLGVPLAEIKDKLPESGECGAGGYNYLDQLSGDETVPVPMIRRDQPRRRVLPALGVLAVVLVLGAGALYVDQKKRQFEALGLGHPAEDAVAKPVPAVEPTTAPAPAPVPAKLVAEDVAVLNETIPQAPGDDFATVPATLVTPAPAATPDDRAAFFVGGTVDPNELDSSGRVQ